MMNECEDDENVGGNPFGEESETEESPADDVSPAESSTRAVEMVEPAQHTAAPFPTPVSAPATPKGNPFDAPTDSRASNRSQDREAVGNPFALGDVDGVRDPAEYEYVSLVAPAVGSMRVTERDWEGEWDHVATAVKKNFTNVAVLSPEVVSSMMMK